MANTAKICGVGVLTIGSKGVECIVEIELAGKDREAFDKSVECSGLVDACRKIAICLGVDFVRLLTGDRLGVAVLVECRKCQP